MGKYTAHQNPAVDELVADHFATIVSAVRAHLEPQSIVLHGSFGRGEGSIMFQDGQPLFLSDYEISVVTPSPFYRGLFARLSQELTDQLGIEVSIAWMRPGRLPSNQPQNLSVGRGDPTIGMYEIKAGGQTLYGQDMLGLGPRIDPDQIPLRAGVRLMINRMAESMAYLDKKQAAQKSRLETIRWINKVVLSCSESLLLAWKAYHYSYAERGRRFAALSEQHLADLPEGAANLPKMVQRATAFKLLPSADLYPADAQGLWPQIIAGVDAVFRYLMLTDLDITYQTYNEFPAVFLHQVSTRKAYNLYRLPLFPAPVDQKLINAIKYLRQHRLPPKGFFSHFNTSANQIVFAMVPTLFLGWSEAPAELAQTNATARHWLSLLGYRPRSFSDPQSEWNELCQFNLGSWKNFCYN